MPPLPFVTLTTDYGCKDYYSAALKASLVRACDNAVCLLDVTHEIEPFNIAQAAYQVQSVLALFPENSIHCVDVASGLSSQLQYVLFRYKNQFVIACDNGLPSLVLERGNPEWFVALNGLDDVPHPSFAAVDIFPNVVKQLVNGADGKSLGTDAQPQPAITLKPFTNATMMRASVMHVDAYENIVLNVHREDFERETNGKNFLIRLRRGNDIAQLSTQYTDVQELNLVAFFNASDYMEVAVNRGNLSGVNNIRVGDTVQIDFL